MSESLFQKIGHALRRKTAAEKHPGMIQDIYGNWKDPHINYRAGEVPPQDPVYKGEVQKLADAEEIRKKNEAATAAQRLQMQLDLRNLPERNKGLQKKRDQMVKFMQNEPEKVEAFHRQKLADINAEIAANDVRIQELTKILNGS